VRGQVVEPPSLPSFSVARGRGLRGGRARPSVMRGRVRVRGRASTLPKEDYTGLKVAFPLDASVWPNYSLLLEFIKKNKRLQVVNGVPPPDSLEMKKMWLTSMRCVLNPLSNQCL
jgi:hypothetical protein